jgi:peptidoglycan-N-acetylglucosamine deacetylase
MLTHRTNIFILLFFVIVLSFFIRIHHWHWSVLFLPLTFFLLIEVIGALVLSANFHFNSVCSFNTNEKVVAITFDDGPHGEDTEKVLSVLKRHNVSCTFFCIGKKIGNDIQLVKRMDEAGHIIANHSYTHANLFDLQTTSKLTEEIELTNKAIKDATGKTPLLFRPPYGVATPALGRAIKRNNMISVGWNIRSFDTSTKNPDKVFEKIKQKIKPGAIILLHDRVTDCDKVVELLLNYLEDNKYAVINIDKLINQPAYA